MLANPRGLGWTPPNVTDEQAAESASAAAIIRQNRKIRAAEIAIENFISPDVAATLLNLSAARTAAAAAMKPLPPPQNVPTDLESKEPNEIIADARASAINLTQQINTVLAADIAPANVISTRAAAAAAAAAAKNFNHPEVERN